MTKAHDNAVALDIKNTWERIYSILVTAARSLGNRQLCHELPGLAAADRVNFINLHWGPAAVQKVGPFLDRIAQLEGTP